MAEDSWNWNAPDYGWGTPQEEAPAYDFGGGTDWGFTDTSNWDISDEGWDMFQPLEEEQPWLNPEFNFEEEYGIPSLYDDPYTRDAYGNTWNMNAPSYDWGNVMDEDWQPDWQNQFSTPSLRDYLGEEVNYGDDPYDVSIGSGMDQYYGDEYGDAWRSPWAVGDDPLAGFDFDAEGNLAPAQGIGSLFPEFGGTSPEDQSLMDIMNAYGINPSQATTQIQPSAEGGSGIRNFLASMFGLGPAGPNAAGVTGRRRPQSPFAGGLGVTPEWLKRIGDRIGLGGRSGLQDAYVTGYPEGTGQGIFGQGGLFGGGGGDGLFGGGGDGGFNLGNLVLPGILGMAAYKAAKEEDLGVPLSPSVTMDPLGRYQLARELGEATADDRGIFGLGKAPASLDFTTMGTPEAAEPYPVAPIQTPFPDNPYYEEGFPPGFTYQPVLGGE